MGWQLRLRGQSSLLDDRWWGWTVIIEHPEGYKRRNRDEIFSSQCLSLFFFSLFLSPLFLSCSLVTESSSSGITFFLPFLSRVFFLYPSSLATEFLSPSYIWINIRLIFPPKLSKYLLTCLSHGKNRFKLSDKLATTRKRALFLKSFNNKVKFN